MHYIFPKNHFEQIWQQKQDPDDFKDISKIKDFEEKILTCALEVAVFRSAASFAILPEEAEDVGFTF